MKAGKKIAGIGDAAVKAATGRSWDQWLRIIDRAGGRKMDHKRIAAVADNHGAGDWWSQMVAVGYEQARGLRKKHERPDGYSVSASKTLAAPVSAAFGRWNDSKSRRAWLPDPAMTIRKATKNKSMRITWVDEKTSVEVNFYAKGPAKSQVTVQHRKLPDEKSAARMKAYWGKALARLADTV